MNLINRILGKTYVVNMNSKEVHNLRNEKAACCLSRMSKKNKKYVTKRKAMEMILLQGYNGCRWCMPKQDTDVH